MQKLFKFNYLFLLIIFSCSTVVRKPSSIDEGRLFVEKPFLQFHSILTDEQSDFDLEAYIKSVNTSYQQRQFGNAETRAVEVVLTEKELAEDVAFSIDAAVKENGTHQVIIIKNTLTQQESTIAKKQIKKFIDVINEGRHYVNIYSFFEAMYNAKYGHLESQKLLKKLQEVTFGNLKEQEVEKASEAREILTQDINDIDTRISALKKDVKLREASRKEVMAALDKASDDGQLRTLLQKNDREGVANLLEKYLPREQMTPIEHKFWDQILYKIRNPVALKDRVLVYRGTYGDRLYPAIEDGKELPYDQAVKEGKLVAMSTVITRNQGTWNRRLRSLQTIYDKKLTMNPNNAESEFTQSSRLTTWMKQHSIEAQGSPFLSYTSNFETGYRFGFNIGKGDGADKEGAKAMGAFLIDPEILVFNQMTSFKGEMEYLHTLVSFPDEMVAFFDESVLGKMSKEEVAKTIKEGFHEKITKAYGEELASDIIENIEKISREFDDQSIAYLHPKTKQIKVETKIPVEAGFLKKMWGKMIGKDVTSYETKVTYSTVIDEMPKMNSCLYIIKSFY